MAGRDRLRGGLGARFGLVPFGYLAVSSVADRYAYLPALGAALAVGDLISRFDRGKEGPAEWPAMLARGLACLWIVVFAALTWSQTAEQY